MARANKTTPSIFKDPGAYRKANGLNQTEFWVKFWTTQSGGSRYEAGRALPGPLKILLGLYALGIINDEDIEKAKKFAGKK